MPSQRETRIGPISFLSLGGTNERVRSTELPPSDYSEIVGTFPEFAGLQGRIFGKRILHKFAKSVYSIYQFWTPMGYGAGLYQSDVIDYGPWPPPGGPIVLPPLPPGILVGGGTKPDLGTPDPPDNYCTIDFDSFGSYHVSCPVINYIDIPSDFTGSPAGPGTTCYWQQGTTVEVACPSPSNTMFGTFLDETFHDDGPPPPPYPTGIEKSPSQPSVYSPGESGFGNIWYASCEAYSYMTNLTGGRWRITQGARSECTKGDLDLSSIIDPAHPPSSIEMLIRHNGNAPFDHTWVDSGISPYQCTGQVASIPINMWAYCKPGYFKGDNPLGGGFVARDFVVIEALRLHYSGRVCV